MSQKVAKEDALPTSSSVDGATGAGDSKPYRTPDDGNDREYKHNGGLQR